MPKSVNLDALIPRLDFEVNGLGDDAPPKDHAMKISDLEKTAFFYGALRKPDFQRETEDWDSKRVVGLIRTFIEDGLIPGVILWKNREYLFVIDGSHRLSALIAWVQDDYGDKEVSEEFFDHDISDEQKAVAEATRKLVEREFRSYKDHREAISNQSAYGPELVKRALRFGSLSLPIQYVKGNVSDAEAAFLRINQQAAMINQQELELIEGRKRPNVIAARAVIRRGTGHKYWKGFKENEQRVIEEIATEVHNLIFEPISHHPIKSLDLPAGGSVSAPPALRMVYDFINLCVGTPTTETDDTGQKTIEYLTRCRRVMQLMLSDHASSLGLHPAVYFYSWTGRQQPVLFLVVTQMIIEYDQKRRLPEFIQIRQTLEEFLMSNRPLVSQVVRKFGTKSSGHTNLGEFYKQVFDLLREGLSAPGVVEIITADPRYSYLQPSESQYEVKPASKFSIQVKSGVVMRELLTKASRCAICGGIVPSQALSVDHKQRRQDGGTGHGDNAQLTHPYCNTGIRESAVFRERKAAGDKAPRG